MSRHHEEAMCQEKLRLAYRYEELKLRALLDDENLMTPGLARDLALAELSEHINSHNC